MNFEIYDLGDQSSDTLLIQPVDDHDLGMLDNEVRHIRDLTGQQSFCLKAVKVNDWTKDLSPWPAPAVFGNEDFGDGADKTLKYIRDNILSDPALFGPGRQIRIFLGGYSLAGLFALWAGYNADCFDGIAAASPSAWFLNFTDYIKEHKLLTKRVYLSLGDREEKTKNPVMSQVGNAIRECHSIIEEAGAECILKWNEGNHFKEPDLRTAKAFAWLMNNGR